MDISNLIHHVISLAKEDEMKEKFMKLIDLKSIVTMIMIISLVIGWYQNKVTSEQFIPLVTMVLTFYFAKNKANSGE